MSDHTMDEQYVTELLARLVAARKAQREAELVAADQASKLATIAAALGDRRMSHSQVVDKIWFMNAKMADLDRLQAAARDALAEPEADDKRLVEGLGTVAWLLCFLVQDSPQPQGLLQAAKETAKLQKDQLETMSPILYRLNQAAAAAVGLSEHAPEDEILGRLAELRQILHDLVGEDALDAKELVTKAKVKIQQLQNDHDTAESFGWQVDGLLRVMVPYSTDNRVAVALEAWQAAGHRSALFQKTGQELGLTDSASPEQILQRAQEVAMVLRSRSQAQDFDANLLAVLGLPANASRDAVLDAIKELVAFRDKRAGVDGFAKHPLLSLSELPVGTGCVAAAAIRASNKRTAFCACAPFAVKEIAPDKSSVFISHDRREVGFWVESTQPAVLASTIKNAPSDDSTRDLALLQDKIAYELGLLSPQLPDCREGLGKAGSLLRLLAQPDRSAALVDLAHAKVKEMTRPRHPGSSFARVHPALFGDLLMALDLPIGTSAEDLVAAVKTLTTQRQNPANKST